MATKTHQSEKATTRGITFVIHPETESVSVGLFLRTITDINRIILDIDYAVTGETGKRKWIISKLHSSAPSVTITPLLDKPEVAEAFVPGLRMITEGTEEPPAHFTEQILSDLKRMKNLFDGPDRAKRLEVYSNGDKPAIIEKGIDLQADRILKAIYWNLGSIDGTLDAINLHRNPTFTVWDRVSGAPVRCYFPKEVGWKERVKSLLEKRVLVRGKVNYFRNGVPRFISDIEELDDMTPNSELPEATFGSIPSREIADDVLEFLRKVRKEG